MKTLLRTILILFVVIVVIGIATSSKGSQALIPDTPSESSDTQEDLVSDDVSNQEDTLLDLVSGEVDDGIVILGGDGIPNN